MRIQNEDISVGLLCLDNEPDFIREQLPDIEVISLEQIAAQRYDVIWVHSQSEVSQQQQHRIAAQLQPHLERGGGLLLSLCAAPIITKLGYESARFRNEVGKWRRKEDFGWKWDFLSEKGFQAFLAHPIFTGLGTSVMTWTSERGKSYIRAEIVSKSFKGDIVAKRKKFIFIETGTNEIIEYHPPHGRIIVILSLLFFHDRANPYLPQLTRLTENTLLYLAGRLNGPRHYWPKKYTHRLQMGEPPRAPIRIIVGKVGTTDDSSMQLVTSADGQWFDIAGHRSFAIGKYGMGIKEVWTSPIRILTDVKFTFSRDGKEVCSTGQQYRVTPTGLDITQIGNSFISRQVMICPLDEPGLLVDVDVESDHDLRLNISFNTDFRLMWPYPKDILNKLIYSWDKAIGAFTFRTDSDEFAAVIGCGPMAEGTFERRRREFRITVPVNVGNKHALFVAYGGRMPLSAARDGYARLMREAEQEHTRAAKHYRALNEDKFNIQCTDHEFDIAYSWAKVGLDKMFARTPGVGNGYFAGYGPSQPTEFSDGRPGYAWYFGRDSEWMSFAALGYGDFDNVRDNLVTLLNHQDVTGKILHELTTSGVAHFDAADSTPLLIIVLEEYVKRSGDIKFLTAFWPRVRKAMDFLYSTDRDRDGFIENSGVGHGWVEGGELSPYHLSFYLASIWVKTLASAAWLARTVGDERLATTYSADYARLKLRLNEEFWDLATGFFHFARRKDGSYIQERTVTPAVAMDFGLITPDKAEKVLRILASSEFSADWGVRFIGRSNPKFRPEGYHQGSVWPLFTGWVAQAEFNYHRPVQGFSHLIANLLNYKGWNEGYIEEVLNGEVYQPNGVCSHQGWSESMAIYPLINGLFGISVNAVSNKLVVAPHLPPHWSEVAVNGIPFGTSAMNMMISSQPGKLSFQLENKGQTAITAQLIPAIPGLTQVKAVRCNGHHVKHKVLDFLQDRHVAVPFMLGEKVKVLIEYDFDLAVIPPKVELVPGRRSRGIRVVNVNRNPQGEIDILMEGPEGTDGYLDVIAKRKPDIKGGEAGAVDENRFRIHFRFPHCENEYSAVVLKCSI